VRKKDKQQVFVDFLNPVFDPIGIKRFSKSIWKSFKVEFKEIEEGLITAKDEITEELRLASEQEAHSFRRLLTSEIEKNRLLRQKHEADMQQNKDFRTQQSLIYSQTRNRQVQKLIKEEGKLQ
jgi:hypothetical protein